MFPDARSAPVHKDGSFTLVSSGLKDHLEDKLYNSMRTGGRWVAINGHQRPPGGKVCALPPQHGHYMAVEGPNEKN